MRENLVLLHHESGKSIFFYPESQEESRNYFLRNVYEDYVRLPTCIFMLVYNIQIMFLGKKILKRTATFGKAGELSDMLCICHSPYEQLCYTGSSTGEIYVWQGSTFRKRMPAHKGPVYAMFALLQSDDKVLR